MNETANIVDIDEGNAQQLLIDESFNRPVVSTFGRSGASPASN